MGISLRALNNQNGRDLALLFLITTVIDTIAIAANVKKKLQSLLDMTATIKHHPHTSDPAPDYRGDIYKGMELTGLIYPNSRPSISWP